MQAGELAKRIQARDQRGAPVHVARGEGAGPCRGSGSGLPRALGAEVTGAPPASALVIGGAEGTREPLAAPAAVPPAALAAGGGGELESLPAVPMAAHADAVAAAGAGNTDAPAGIALAASAAASDDLLGEAGPSVLVTAGAAGVISSLDGVPGPASTGTWARVHGTYLGA